MRWHFRSLAAPRAAEDTLVGKWTGTFDGESVGRFSMALARDPDKRLGGTRDTLQARRVPGRDHYRPRRSIAGAERLARGGATKEASRREPRSQLRKIAGFAFYNTSRYDFEKLLADAPHVAANLRNYIAGFSPNMREVLEKFDFDNTISKLAEAGLLFQVLERFRNVDLHPSSSTTRRWGRSSRS